MSQLNAPRRVGFTLLEMLITISIIGVLAGLTLIVMNGVTNQAEQEATKATIRKINGLLQRRVESFHRAFRGTRRDNAVNQTLLALNAGIQAQLGRPFPLETLADEAAIPIIARKREFQFYFPQRVEDRLNDLSGRDGQAVGSALTAPGLLQSWYELVAAPLASQQLISEGSTPPLDPTDINLRVSENWSRHDRSTESSELLYFALTRLEDFGAGAAAPDAFTDAEVADTDGDGFLEFVDAWGNPLQFYRWPTRLVDWDVPVPFRPILAVPDDATDIRVITADEREAAEILMSGLPPAPGAFPGGVQREYLLVDPDDPVGLIYTLLENPYYQDIGIDLSDIINETTLHSIDTWHAPLIVSAGVDGVLGLYEPWRADVGVLGTLAQIDGTNFSSGPFVPAPSVVDAMRDNVTNVNRRAGSQR